MTKRDSQLPNKVKKRDNNTCVKCGRKPSGKSSTRAHHIRPVSYDGPDTMENMATLCTHCDKYVPESVLDPEWYHPIFEDFIATGVRPEVDLARFGAESGVDGEVISKVFKTIIETVRTLENEEETTQQEFYWMTMAMVAGYGSVSEAVDVEPLKDTADIIESGENAKLSEWMD